MTDSDDEDYADWEVWDDAGGPSVARTCRLGATSLLVASFWPNVSYLTTSDYHMIFTPELSPDSWEAYSLLIDRVAWDKDQVYWHIEPNLQLVKWLVGFDSRGLMRQIRGSWESRRDYWYAVWDVWWDIGPRGHRELQGGKESERRWNQLSFMNGVIHWDEWKDWGSDLQVLHTEYGPIQLEEVKLFGLNRRTEGQMEMEMDHRWK